MTDAEQEDAGKRPPIVTGPDGHPWYGMADDGERWQRFVRDYLNWDSGGKGLQDMMFCNANRRIDISKAGPLREFLRERCSKAETPDRILAHGAEHCLGTTKDKYACIAEVREMLSIRHPIMPLIPVNFAETVAYECGVELDGGAKSHDLVATVNRERVRVLMAYARKETLYKGRQCPVRDFTEARFRLGYESALRAGASPEAAFCVGDAINKPPIHCHPSWWGSR